MKTFKIFSMAAVALLMAACSNSDDFDVQKPAETAGVYHFEATIAAPNADTSMRTVYTEDGATINVKWKVGDKIALVHNGVVDEAEVKTVDNVTGKATIEATIKGSPADNDDVYLAYPADAVESATPSLDYGLPFTPNTTTFNKVRNQDGTLGYIQNNLDLRMGFGQLAVSGDKVTLKESVSVSSLICIWKLTLQDESSNALSATKLTFTNNNFIQARATSTGDKSEYYLCVVPSFFPDPSGTFSFKATVGSDTYTFSKTGLSLTAGKYYQSTVTMAKQVVGKALAESTVGMIVGTDGKAYAVADKDNLPSGVTAVAMVAYKSGSNGLAIQLNGSSEKMNLAQANTYPSGLTSVPDGTWRLPSKDDWQNMFVGCAESGDATVPDAYNQMDPIAGFKAKIAATGITWNSSVNYWSSTESGMMVWLVGVNLGDSSALAAFAQIPSSTAMLAVRAVLAF